MKKIIFVGSFIFSSFLCLAQNTENLTVYFKFNVYVLDAVYINKIDSIIRNKIIVEVHVAGHCDSIGSNEYNDALSLKRALKVKEYITSKIPGHVRVDIKAFGKRAPLNKNENETARALNRRAEIVFIMRNPEPVMIADTLRENNATSTNKNSETLAKDTGHLDLDIQNAEVGSSIRLENLNFHGGRHFLLAKSQKTLELLLKTMQENPTLEIEIQGHICCMISGDGMDFDTRTMNLSVNRAKAVYEYLITNGISRKRLSYRGFGADHKLVREYTDRDEETNRRVEIKIIKK